jgi:hypothetical protein
MVFARKVIIKLIISSAVMLIFVPRYGHATDPFKAYKLSPSVKTYLVLRDVNVRAKPMNKSMRVTQLKKNERVSAVGKVRGTRWIAVRKKKKNIGFVYNKALMPVINGGLLKSISSNKLDSEEDDSKLSPCHYKIKFVGKLNVKGSLQVTSDYNLEMECNHKNKRIKIEATMFLTELPYLENALPIFQINVDLYDIPIGTEDMFSTTVLYHALENRITFDGVNKKHLKSNKQILEKKAADVSSALKGAVSMAHQSWGPIIWSDLSKYKQKH